MYSKPYGDKNKNHTTYRINIEIIRLFTYAKPYSMNRPKPYSSDDVKCMKNHTVFGLELDL